MTKRYEYFGSKGNMIGYEFYNNMTRQWEYYENTTQKGYQEPSKVDITPTLNAQSTLQGRYDNNTAFVQQEINKMILSVNNLEISDEQKNQIIQTFKGIPLKSVNNQTINYSSLSATNDVLNYLQDSLRKIINNVTRSNFEQKASSNTTYNSSLANNDAISNKGEKFYEEIYNKKLMGRDKEFVLSEFINLFNNYSNYSWDRDFKNSILIHIIKLNISLKKYYDASLYNEKMFALAPNTKSYYFLNKAQIYFEQNDKKNYGEILKYLKNISQSDERDFDKDFSNPLNQISNLDYKFLGDYYSLKGISKIKTGNKTSGCADIQIAIKNSGNSALYYNYNYCRK